MIAAIYARKSTEQAEAQSVTRQVENAKAFAASKGWTVDDDHIFIDDGISGAETVRLRERTRMIDAASRHAFDVVIMQAQDRFSRGEHGHYELKQLAKHVEIWFYAGKERFESGTFKANTIGFLQSEFAAEYRVIAAKTSEAMLQKAKAGHVTGGRLFGYTNVRVNSHVERQINEAEAAIIRRIFDLSVEGHGVKAIAKKLNEDGAPSPRAQRGRSQTWAPSSVREVLHRDVYRGVIVYNRTKKCNDEGIHAQTNRPRGEWITVPAPSLQIISDDSWQAAHTRLGAVRGVYLTANRGQQGGRPKLGDPSKYLLTNLVTCGCCGGPMKVCSRSHGQGRKHFYGCSWYHDRGKSVCANGSDVPMTEADDIVIEGLLDDVLDQDMVEDAVDEALRLLQGDDAIPDLILRVEAQLAAVDQERSRLVTAIATGGALDGLLLALHEREATRARLLADRDRLHAERRLDVADATRVRDELLTLAAYWRSVLADDPGHARPIVANLLTERVTIVPTAKGRWRLSGHGTLKGLFGGEILSRGMASPTRQGIVYFEGPLRLD